jgi:hypothetical protein
VAAILSAIFSELGTQALRSAKSWTGIDEAEAARRLGRGACDRRT